MYSSEWSYYNCTTVRYHSVCVVLYGCETWSLTLKEEHGLRVFENRVLRRIFGSKRDEVTGGWRKLHNEELHNLYSSPSHLLLGLYTNTKLSPSIIYWREPKSLSAALVSSSLILTWPSDCSCLTILGTVRWKTYLKILNKDGAATTNWLPLQLPLSPDYHSYKHPPPVSFHSVCGD
jgi:hypothetical protein